MQYQFFAYDNIDAAVGLAARDRQLAVHLPSQGGTTGGRRRNPARRELLSKLLDAQVAAHPTARVLACRAGRNDNARQVVGQVMGGPGRGTLESAYGGGAGFRFDYWLNFDDVVGVADLAEQLGLTAVEHSPMNVLWPDGEGEGIDDEDDDVEAFGEKLNALIEGVADPSSTDSSKWRGVEDLVAEAVQLDRADVIVGYASERKHILNRLRQRNGQANVRVLIAPDDETTKHARKILEEMAQGKRKTDAATLALVTSTLDGWRVVDIWPTRTPTPDTAIRLSEATGVPLPEGADDEEALAKSLFVPVEWLRDVLWLLEDKRGLVFYGPPGTGKTYIANKIAQFLQADERRRTIVQLHPSFGYEEFFEGYRPTASDAGVPGLLKCDGPLKLLVRELKDDDVGVLVLDEMNRGNLPRVFGELYFLLEYRDRPVRLMYAEEEDRPFVLPEGLRIIGTMNTADRSVALLDQALRRRFHFVGLFPREEPVAGMLRGYLADHYGDSMNWVADVLDAANAKLDRNVAIGPSHFMRPDLDAETVARIWRHSVLPTIEEHYFGQEDRVAEFELAALKPRRHADDRPAPE